VNLQDARCNNKDSLSFVSIKVSFHMPAVSLPAAYVQRIQHPSVAPIIYSDET